MPTTENNIEIKGITWGHSRGYTPLMAAAQRYTELNPNSSITWEKRTLQQFADYPIEHLAKTYDLLIIDHPWVGTAARTQSVLPLEQHLPAEYLRDQAENSVGYSYHSYNYQGHQWALAIDAATPIASYRADLLKKAPENWEEVLTLAKKGRVALPGIPIDLLMNFFMFCIASGSRPFQSEHRVIDPATGEVALDTMLELYTNIDKKFFNANPIAVAEHMTKTDEYWYCPFAYGYSNYSREGYTSNPLTYTDLPYVGKTRLRSTIGGTGLAVSATSKHIDTCLDFAQWICKGTTQRTFYTEHGGQPGHRSAWLNEKANRLTNNYFYSTLPAMERGYMRPRYHGYLYFQDHAGDVIQECILGNSNIKSTLQTLENLYAQSLQKHAVHS